MPYRGLADVVDSRIKKKVEKAKEGKVVSVGPVVALVQLVGSATPIPCAYDAQSGVSVGKRVSIQWIGNAKKYVITGVFGAVSGSVVASDQAAENFELTPPSSFTADDSLPSSIVVTWDVPPNQNITFEVQQNTSALESGAAQSVGGMTRGSMLIVSSDDTLYFRIRSISPNFRYSSWSNWISSAAGAPFSSDHMSGWVAQERVVTTPRITPDGTFTLIIGDLDVQPGGSVEVLGDVYIAPESDYA